MVGRSSRLWTVKGRKGAVDKGEAQRALFVDNGVFSASFLSLVSFLETRKDECNAEGGGGGGKEEEEG